MCVQVGVDDPPHRFLIVPARLQLLPLAAVSHHHKVVLKLRFQFKEWPDIIFQIELSMRSLISKPCESALGKESQRTVHHGQVKSLRRHGQTSAAEGNDRLRLPAAGLVQKQAVWGSVKAPTASFSEFERSINEGQADTPHGYSCAGGNLSHCCTDWINKWDERRLRVSARENLIALFPGPPPNSGKGSGNQNLIPTHLLS